MDTLNSPALEKLLREGELADMLDVSIDTVRKWRRKGRGPAFIRAEGSVRYEVQEVVKYLAARRVSHEKVVSQ